MVSQLSISMTDGCCPTYIFYPISITVSEKLGKDNFGEYVFVRDSNNQPKLDKNDYMITSYDLHNHSAEPPEDMAGKFIEWAKKGKLSFWK